MLTGACLMRHGQRANGQAGERRLSTAALKREGCILSVIPSGLVGSVAERRYSSIVDQVKKPKTVTKVHMDSHHWEEVDGVGMLLRLRRANSWK